jgi:hypothetical protein
MSPTKPFETHVERLRVEAGAAQWQEFDDAQQQAYLRIAAMIAEAIGDVPALNERAREREAVRRTRSAFVIGGRGTGKTTVLDTFRRDSRPGSTRSGDVTRSRPELDQQEKRARDRQMLLEQIRGRVVWLETLDMEPLPPETNLLASILVRLEDAAREFGGEAVRAPRKPPGLIEPSSEYHSALLELQRLQTDVALAWEGNLRARQGALDPDAYAVEVMRVEKARLSLNTRFAETLNKLAQHVFRSRDVDDVLFILPVDDFDLNPPICLDLLRVLRLISIPRLFTIALGDLNVASTVLSLKLSNDLGSIVRQLETPMIAVLPSTVASLAGDVAANAIRKLLPPGQRIELWPMRLPEAMNFRPLGSVDTDLFLHELLARCAVYSGWNLPPVPGTQPTALERPGEYGRSSLRQLLLAPKLFDPAWRGADDPRGSLTTAIAAAIPATPLARTEAEAAIYSGTRFIQAPPRRVADTWVELYKIDHAAPTLLAGGANEPPEKLMERKKDAFDPLLTFFAEACRAALRETPLFMPTEREDVERAVSRNVGGSWTLRPLPVTLRTETAAPRPIALTPPDAHAAQEAGGRTKSMTERPRRGVTPSAPLFHPAAGLGWQIEIYVGSTGFGSTHPPGLPADWEERRPRRVLSDNAVTALIMYHDLLAFSPDGARSFETPLLTTANLEISWAATEWKLSTPVVFRWPAPPCTTFFDFDSFKAAWNDVQGKGEVVQSTRPEDVIERLAFAWLSIGFAVVKKVPPLPVPSWAAPLPWAGLIQGMAGSVAHHEFAERSRRTEWLRRVAELLMPEMGLPAKVTDPFKNSPDDLKQIWLEQRVALRQRRLDRLRTLHEHDPGFAERVRKAPTFLEHVTPNSNEVTGLVVQPQAGAVTEAGMPPAAQGAESAVLEPQK